MRPIWPSAKLSPRPRASNLLQGLRSAFTVAVATEVMVNPKLKQLMRELGEAINESLSESEQISEVIAKIKNGGYDVFLVLEATIGFNKTDDDSKPLSSGRREPEFKVNPQDMKFLKSLKISLDDAA